MDIETAGTRNMYPKENEDNSGVYFGRMLQKTSRRRVLLEVFSFSVENGRKTLAKVKRIG